MLGGKMEQLDNEIEELEKKLQELKRKKEEEKRRLSISILKFQPSTGKVSIKLSKYRSDIVDYIRINCPDRIYNEQQGNIFSAAYLQPFLDHIAKDPSIAVAWERIAFENWESYKNRPDVYVDILGAYVTLSLGPRMANSYLNLLTQIPSFTNEVGKGYRFAVAEFYLFPSAFEYYESWFDDFKLIYSDAARETLYEQLEKRKEISELANAKDYPMESPFKNGYDLKPHQRVAVRFLELTGYKGIVAYDMGTGKTPVGIALAERHPEFRKVLVICPAALKTNWRREIKKFTDHEAVIFSGIEPDDLSIGQWVSDNRYYIINYDIIGRESGDKTDPVMKWVVLLKTLKPDFVIIDEAHYIKNMDSKRSRGVRALTYNAVAPMSGTPLVNRPIELYPPLSIVDPLTFKSAASFFDQFCASDGTARNVKKLHEMMLPYMIRRTRKDVYGDSIHIERIPFTKELSPKARELYTKILQGIYIALRKPDKELNVTSIFAELIRCKQTCSADNILTTVELALDAFEETEKKVIIFSQFKDSQYGINQMLDGACVVNGDVVDDDRYDLMDKFQDPTSGLNFWITNILEGLTLTEAHTVIFNDIWWTPKDHSQAEGRCFGRDNDPHGGNSYWIENERTIDQFLNALLMKKTEVFNQVIDGVRDSQEEQRSIMSQLIQHLKESM